LWKNDLSGSILKRIFLVYSLQCPSSSLSGDG
jgi:hypothetical protein